MLFEVVEKQEKVLSIESIKELISAEFQAVNSLIKQHLRSHVPLIEEISDHIIQSGGKRLRPMIVLLVAKAFDYKGSDHIALAAVVEFIHTATLLHDDVVDNSSLRRGQQTANTIWGNATSVLVGDFLYSRTFEILTHLSNMPLMDLLAKTTNAIAEGEVLQLSRRNDPQADEAHYMQVIASKTARLFQAAAEVAALICKRSTEEQDALAAFGHHLGMAFQLIDDALDFTGDSEALGKNVGDDLAEGKPTLPLIHALQFSQNEHKQLIKDAILHGCTDNLDAILQAIQETKSLDYTIRKAQDEASLALAALKVLPDSIYKSALSQIVDFSVRRQF